MTTEQHPHPKTAMWMLWPWVTWLLPGLLVLSRIASERAGWETVFLIVASPIAIPAIGLLGSLPRFLLRRRGFTYVPTTIAVLLVIQWWALTFFVHSMTATGDSGSAPSMLGEALHLTNRIAEFLSAVAILTWLSLFITTIVVAAVLSKRGPQDPPKTRVPLTVFVLTPVLIAVVAMGASQWQRASTLGAPDHAGVTAEEAQAVTDPAEVLALAEERWDAFQAEAAPLRDAISDDWWIVDYTLGGGVFPDDVPEVPVGYERYSADWKLFTREPADELAERTEQWLVDNGWDIDERRSVRPVRYDGHAPSGTRFSVTIRTSVSDESDDPGFTIVGIDLQSEPFWEHGGVIDWEAALDPAERSLAAGIDETTDFASKNLDPQSPELIRDPEMGLVTFGADEWPSLVVSVGAHMR